MAAKKRPAELCGCRMKLDVSVKGIDESVNFLHDFGTNLPEQSASILHSVGESIVADARHTIQQNRNINTGSLLSSVRILMETKEFIIVGSDAPYAGYIEFGRGPVVAPPGKVLHWIDKTTGEDVFAKRAKATEPQPFLHPAVIRNTKSLKNRFVLITEESARRNI